MSKSINKLKYSEKQVTLDALMSVAECMSSRDGVVTFINELLTESERITIGRRILIAQLILAGKSQAEISYNFNVSPNTFSRTRKWLQGQVPHYEDSLKAYQLEVEDRQAKKSLQNRQQKEHIESLTFSHLRKQYPMHFLLFNLADAVLKKFKPLPIINDR